MGAWRLTLLSARAQAAGAVEVPARDIDDSRPGRMGYVYCQDPADPNGEARVTYWIVNGDLNRKMKHQPWVGMNVPTAFETLRYPARIYQGYRKDDGGEWQGLAYVGRPTHYRTEEGDGLPLPPDRVYVVFVKENGDITEWGKERCDPAAPDVPLESGVDSRFQEQVWPSKEA